MMEAVERALAVRAAVAAHIAKQAKPPLISLVFTHHGVSCQVFLDWEAGKPLRRYIQEPCLLTRLSLNGAMHSRILDQNGIHRRLYYVPNVGDEFRFLHRDGRR